MELSFTMPVLLLSIVVLVLLLFGRLFYLLVAVRRKRKVGYCSNGFIKLSKIVKTMIVMGSGGHSGEMIKLVSKLPQNYYPRVYIIADTDRLSEEKVKNLENTMPSSNQRLYTICRTKRSREVHQSWSSTVLTTALATIDSLKIFIRNKPDLLLCNGPGTCVPMCLIAFISRIFFVKPSTKIIFVESICRVKSISLSGKILYYVADQFIVLWPQLTKKYPYTTYLGWLF